MARIQVALAFLVSALVAAVPASATLGENLIAQWTFDEGINGWDNLAGKLWEQQDDCRPLPEQPNPGSLEMLADDYVSQCIGIIGEQPYYISTFVKVMMDDVAYGRFGITVLWHSDSFCEDYMEGFIIHPFAQYAGATDWTKLAVEGHPPLGAHSAKVILGAAQTHGNPDTEIRVRFDDVIVAPLYTGVTTTTTTTLNETTTTTDDTTTTTDKPNAPGCADPVVPYDTTTVADALYVLRNSVGAVICDACMCDTDNSGSTTTGDALRVLRIAVGQKVLKDCEVCVTG